MLTLSALFACVLLPHNVVFADDEYIHFANWLLSDNADNDTSSLKQVCTLNNAEPAPGFNPKDNCTGAWGDESAAWEPMCTALGDNHPCPYTDEPSRPKPYTTTIQDISDCCTITCPVLTEDKKYDTNDECCAVCAGPTDKMPTTPPTSQTTSATSSNSTTMEPTPSPEDTTTMESTTKEGGSDSDSAINIGASGLLITLITMMAAVVNIA